MVKESPLGQATVYVQEYMPELLFPVPRKMARDKTGITEPLPFDGYDVWNGYEISWIDQKGKPHMAFGQLSLACTTPNIVESKSLKLYLNSFNQTAFESIQAVQETIQSDLEKIIQAPISVSVFYPNQPQHRSLHAFEGICLDSIDTEGFAYRPRPDFLKTSSGKVDESVYTDLFKSNCLATGQPDWGSVWIRYVGNKIDHAGLFKYLMSFRNHNGFAEHCVEQIFNDISSLCRPEKLTVYARFIRRGGWDINPFRSNFETEVANLRHIRQ